MKKIVNAETEEGQELGETIIEVVKNQIADNDPPETKKTLERLIALGEPEENAMRYIASALSVELFDTFNNLKPFDEKRYIKNLKALPKLPFD